MGWTGAKGMVTGVNGGRMPGVWSYTVWGVLRVIKHNDCGVRGFNFLRLTDNGSWAVFFSGGTSGGVCYAY